MSDFEKYVPAAAKAIRETPWKRTTFWEDENGIPVDDGDPRAVHQDYMSSEDYEAEARAVLELVGPLIAEDTRERMVAAAARAVERDGVIEEPAVADAAQPPIIICEPRKDCADPHIHRWHCMRGHDGADPGVCPLEYCDRKGANR